MTAYDLTEKQYTTLRQLLAGRTCADIARAHGVTDQAVRELLSRLRRRIGIRTLIQLGAWCERHGIREAGQGS